MITNNLISIIVPCYNQAAFLDEALQSVSNQTYPHWECIIVDDGSPDETGTIAQRWCARDTRFKYIKKTNGGVSSSRNVGLQAASGTYILPLDGDDKISANYLEGCLNEFEKNPKTKVVYGNAEFFGVQTGAWDLTPFDYNLQLTRNLIYCTAMFRKSDCTAIGGYDEQMVHGLEDWDFWLRMIGEHDIVTKVSSILFFYRIKQSSRNADLNKAPELVNETYVYLYQKHAQQMNRVMGNPIQLYLMYEEEKRNLDQLKHGAKALGPLGRLMFGILRKTGHILLNRNKTS